MVDQRFYELVKHLWRDGEYAYYWTPDTDEGNLSMWFPVNKPKKVIDSKSINIYFPVHPSGVERGQRQRSLIETVCAVNCLFAEFDLSAGQPKEHLLEAINQLDIPPSVIVFSGGGYHCYWLLDQTYHIDSDDARQRIIDIQYAWDDFVTGDNHVKDLARVLRVPGTYNCKPEYAKPPLVEIVKFDMDLQYGLDELNSQVEDRIIAAKAKKYVAQQSDVVMVDLDDHTIVEKMRKKDKVADALWGGDISGHKDDHSNADLALCNKLAFWFGRDRVRIDRAFRASGLMRPKWLRDDYRNRTLDKAIADCTATYTPQNANVNMGNPEDLIGAKPSMSTHPPSPSHSSGKAKSSTKTAAPKAAKKTTTQAQRTLSDDYIQKLESQGYQFKLNELDDTVEVNGQRIDNVIAAEIRTRMRDIGFNNMAPIEDAYLAHAGQSRYHAVKDYLSALTWDGNDYIMLLSAMVTDDHAPLLYNDGDVKSVFYAYLRRWLVGAVAKAFNRAQNFMLVIDAKQGSGKSSFAKWLGSGLAPFFIESAIKTDDKEHDRLLATKWIWEVAELGATTRRQDVEALKSFLTKHDVTFRVPWGKHAIVKPALASFIGTINNENGFLTDITGNRRFCTVRVNSFDWNYTSINVDQLWAQAYRMWMDGEPSSLLPEEVETRDRINTEYQIEDPYESWILKYYDIDKDKTTWKTTTQEIADFLQTKGVRGETRAIQMQVSKTLKSFDLKQDSNARPRVWKGIKIKSNPLNYP
jgi:predicted P-loop ATPase